MQEYFKEKPLKSYTMNVLLPHGSLYLWFPFNIKSLEKNLQDTSKYPAYDNTVYINKLNNIQ